MWNLLKAELLKLRRCQILWVGLVAVSYTHLDVYKRQGLLYCADCGGKMYVHRTNNGKRISQYTCSPVSYTHLDVYKRQIHIRTHNTDLKKRMLAYSRRYPENCKQTDTCLLYTSIPSILPSRS